MCYVLSVLKDDSYQNCKKAPQLGRTVAHFVEEDVKPPKAQASKFQIRHAVLRLRSL